MAQWAWLVALALILWKRSSAKRPQRRPGDWYDGFVRQWNRFVQIRDL